MKAVSVSSSHRTRKEQIMKRRNATLLTLLTLAISPLTSAEIFKCNGPDGPIFTDRKCGPDATSVEVSDSSGLTGVSDETKTELAAKKAAREKAREEIRKRNNNRTVINNQYITNTEPAGRWLAPYYWRPKPERPELPVDRPRPLPLPSSPGRPTLPSMPDRLRN